jgi:hypothetical protein
MLFGQPDKVPLWPGEPGESTLRVWHQQGLPKGVDYHQYLLETLGISDAPVTTRVDLRLSQKNKFS